MFIHPDTALRLAAGRRRDDEGARGCASGLCPTGDRPSSADGGPCDAPRWLPAEAAASRGAGTPAARGT